MKIVLFAAVALVAGSAHAGDTCKAVALRTTVDLASGTHAVRKGAILPGVDLYFEPVPMFRGSDPGEVCNALGKCYPRSEWRKEPTGLCAGPYCYRAADLRLIRCGVVVQTDGKEYTSPGERSFWLRSR